MNSKEAIDLLSIDGRTLVKLLPTQASEIAELIQQQDKMLELAIYKLSACCCGFIKDCGMDDEQTCEDCWRKYLQSEVGK